MSKRFIFPQQNGERKKAKLDVTVSDHNFPLSQNGPNKESDNWGDDNDDEILLLASQACEDAYNDISSLPDYSMCMQPSSTSTQMCDSGPSTSKAGFTFKKPSSIPSSIISTNLKDKYNGISSPLPGMTSNVLPKHETVDLNYILNEKIYRQSMNNMDKDNEKIYKCQDSEYVYRQLLQLQEENAKLKSENGKLLEKCVTKEGEASILRTQLKSCQVAVDNARMEKIKAQEKVQMEWTEKLSAANGQVHELRTQLDFKNLEIISVKERCRMLESNKVKLTQVTVTANDINSSHRNNTSTSDYAPPARRVKVTSSSVQTEDKAHFLKLNKTYRSEPSKLTAILPTILEPTTEQHSILEYNEKLQKQTDLSQNKCRIYSTFHRIPSTPADRQSRGAKVVIGSVYEDLTSLAAETPDDGCFTRILSVVKSVLTEARSQLELVSQKVTTSFLKEMDEKYVDATASLVEFSERDLLCGKPLYKEEQAILARRMTAVCAITVRNCTDVQFNKYEDQISQYMEIIQRICFLLDTTSCALLYSGLLLSITTVADSLVYQTDYKMTIDILRSIISSRPMLFVSCQVLKILRKLSKQDNFIQKLCPGGTTGNLRTDYDQGVLLYKKDSCYVQILLKQVEVSLKCTERQRLIEQAVNTTRDLLALYSNVTDVTVGGDQEKLTGCDCQLILQQVIVYALKICAVMLKNINAEGTYVPASTRLAATCRSGALLLYQCVLRDVEFTSQLAHNEGHLIEFCETMRCFDHSELYANMLSELSGTFQSSPEDEASSFSRQPWMKSFDAFSIAD